MRHGAVWVLALALIASAARFAAAEAPSGGSGGVFTRWFKRPASPARAEKDEEPKAISLTAAKLAKEARQAQAMSDWMRRSEVCLKLRDVAHETGDDELWRKADQLEQRAYDAFVQQTQRGASTVDETALQRRLPKEDVSAGARLLRLGRAKDEGQAQRKGER